MGKVVQKLVDHIIHLEKRIGVTFENQPEESEDEEIDKNALSRGFQKVNQGLPDIMMQDDYTNKLDPGLFLMQDSIFLPSAQLLERKDSKEMTIQK